MDDSAVMQHTVKNCRSNGHIGKDSNIDILNVFNAVQEIFDKAERLAKALKASICYTRPMVDMGYVDNENAMIGTSGKMIRLKLYVGFGVSGSSHHVCGMKDSGLIISVNTNEKADIFDVSNYKLIGDSGTVLDELLVALE